jgi:uncharacterized membrane protein
VVDFGVVGSGVVVFGVVVFGVVVFGVVRREIVSGMEEVEVPQLKLSHATTKPSWSQYKP